MAKISADDKIINVVQEARNTDDLELAEQLLSKALLGKISVEAKMLLLLERSACLKMVGDAQGSMDDCDEVLALAADHGYKNKEVTIGEITFNPVKEAHASFCWALIDVGDYPMAMDACNAALHIQADDYWMLFARGLIRLYLGDADAKDDFEKAKRISLDADGQCYAASVEALNKIKVNQQIEAWGKSIFDAVLKGALKLG